MRLGFRVGISGEDRVNHWLLPFFDGTRERSQLGDVVVVAAPQVERGEPVADRVEVDGGQVAGPTASSEPSTVLGIGLGSTTNTSTRPGETRRKSRSRLRAGAEARAVEFGYSQ
jgi:hypothetical protein